MAVMTVREHEDVSVADYWRSGVLRQRSALYMKVWRVSLTESPIRLILKCVGFASWLTRIPARWVVNLRSWACYLLSLLRMHTSDC